MADLTDAEIDAALERGKMARETELHAVSAHYDSRADRVVVDLNNGCTFAFPPHLAQGLEDATADQLAEIEVSPAGFGLRWDVLNVDFTVPGLIAGIFGTKASMARRAGQATSAAKAAAARKNGQKGGRPRRTVAG